MSSPAPGHHVGRASHPSGVGSGSGWLRDAGHRPPGCSSSRRAGGGRVQAACDSPYELPLDSGSACPSFKSVPGGAENPVVTSHSLSAPHRTNFRGEAGFTLVETLVVIVIMGVAAAIAVGGFQSYARSAEHSGTRNDIVSALRAAHQRALTEATVYCVRFAADGTSWTTFRGTCATGTKVKGPEDVGGRNIALTSVDFTRPDGTTGSQDVEFTARGTATKGSLTIVRSGSSKTYTVSVEGLTARVSSS